MILISNNSFCNCDSLQRPKQSFYFRGIILRDTGGNGRLFCKKLVTKCCKFISAQSFEYSQKRIAPPPPIVIRTVLVKSLNPTRYWGGGCEASSSTFLRHDQYYCMCIKYVYHVLQKSNFSKEN